MLGAKQIILRQAVEQPTKRSDVTASDLLPLKAAQSVEFLVLETFEMLVMAQCNIAQHGGVEAIKVSIFSMSLLSR
jgi:hypothetical protein